jgi:hypothetical protein
MKGKKISEKHRANLSIAAKKREEQKRLLG